MINRIVTNEIQEALKRQAVVALIGPRQVGKTTLALKIGEQHNAVYLDLEDKNDRARLANPTLFFERNEDNLVILDEIHRMPEIFQTLRGVIDKGRRNDKGKGRFLILGSASIDLLKQSGETLAGRITYIDMTPLTVLELEDNRENRDRLWLRGGFPESYLASTDRDSLIWRKDFIRTYLERDIPMFGPRVSSEIMERLWTMLSHLQGTMLNASDLARSLQVSSQSVTRYIDLLSDLLLIRRLPPYYANVGKRLVKSPKIYIRDSGVVHALLGLETINQLMGHPVVGMSWEGFVIENLLSNLPWRSHAFFYRTAAGAEIDLVIEHGDGTFWAIEIKQGLSPKLGKGFHQAYNDIKPSKSFIVYAGHESYPLEKDIEVISLYKMIEELRKAIF